MASIHHPDLAAVPMSAVFAALADPTRVAIVRALLRAEPGSCACSDLSCEVERATGQDAAKSRMSHHVKVLREAGIVRQRREGTKRITEVREAELEARFPGLLRAVLEDGGPV